MAELKVFVSSTCYDLSLLRSQLRLFIKNLGYEPIMSDYEDILYDPRTHTHTSCVDEVKNCDVLVLIIGSRFGGKATLEALNRIDFEALKNESVSIESLKEKECLSVTQLEVLTAIENSIPVYTFIEKRVLHDHALYEKNKSSDIIEKIIFPSIEKQETAKYIFNFINFVRHRTRNNNIFAFEKGQDIEEILKKQWSSYFQRLLREQRYVEGERKRFDVLSDRFEELKTAILTSINDGDQRDIARGTLKYRRLFDFVLSFKTLDLSYIKSTHDSWDDMLKQAGVNRIVLAGPYDSSYPRPNRPRAFIVMNDDSFYELLRMPPDVLNDIALDWSAFISMGDKSREIIGDTLADITRPMFLHYVRKSFSKEYPQHCESDDEEESSGETLFQDRVD